MDRMRRRSQHPSPTRRPPTRAHVSAGDARVRRHRRGCIAGGKRAARARTSEFCGTSACSVSGKKPQWAAVLDVMTATRGGGRTRPPKTKHPPRRSDARAKAPTGQERACRREWTGGDRTRCGRCLLRGRPPHGICTCFSTRRWPPRGAGGSHACVRGFRRAHEPNGVRTSRTVDHPG